MPAYQIYNVPLFKIEFLGGAVNKNSPLLMNFRFVEECCIKCWSKLFLQFFECYEVVK